MNVIIILGSCSNNEIKKVNILMSEHGKNNKIFEIEIKFPGGWKRTYAIFLFILVFSRIFWRKNINIGTDVCVP